MNIVGLFAGIGGIEYGFYGCGHNTSLLCEIMPEAESVLKDRFKMQISFMMFAKWK